MSYRLVIDGNSVYEIDETCIKKNESVYEEEEEYVKQTLELKEKQE